MHWISFVFIVLLSAVFRVTNLNIIEFKTDEASNLLLASRSLFGHPFPYGGVVSSIGILNPPLFNYLLFPIVAITLDPRSIVFVIALLNSLALGLFFLLVKRYYNYTLAFIAAIILAFSPWAIIFSRKIWPPDLIIPFSILLLYSLHKLVLQKKTIFWIPIVTLSLLLVQLDLSSAFFVVAMFFFLFLQKPKINYSLIFLGLSLGLIPAIPYFIYELTNNCPDCFLLLNLNNYLPGIRSPEVFLRPLQIINQGNFYFLLGDDTLTFVQKFPLIYKLRTFMYLEYILIPLGMFIFWKRHKKFRFLIYSTLLLPLVYFLFRLQPFMHYFVIMVPILSVSLAFSLYVLLSSKKIMLKCMGILTTTLIVISSLTFNFATFKLIQEQKGLKGDYGTSFEITRKNAEKLLRKYRKDKEYQEMLIAIHIPLHIMQGDGPIAKMIYPYRETTKHLSSLEKRLEIVPSDPRVQQELFAYYTTNLTRSSVSQLRSKKISKPIYKKIFNEVYNLYLFKNLKKLHKSSIPPFYFEYPNHWKVIENYKENKLTIKSDTISMSIRKSLLFENIMDPNNTYLSKEIKVLGKTIQRLECQAYDQKWCGVKFSPFQIDKYYYEIEYVAEKNILKSKALNDTIFAMDEIVESFIYANLW